MNVAILYHSRSGNTARAAQLAGKRLADLGARVSVRDVDAYDIKEMAEADVILLGTWTDGGVLWGQRPARMGKFKKLPSLHGKTIGVFCTYKFWPGKTLFKFGRWAQSQGATSIGGHAINKKTIEEGANEFARLMANELKLELASAPA